MPHRASDPWSRHEEDSWGAVVAELRRERPLQRRWAAFRWWWARWRDPGFRRHVLLPLDRHRPALVALLGRAFTVAMAYVVLHTLFPDGMAPGQPLWVVCLVWVVATHVGEAFEAAGAPKALGMLLAGVALRSLPAANGGLAPLEGLSRAWSRDIRAGAMGLVLLRSGLGLNLRTVRSYGVAFFAFVTLPSLCESLLGAAVARALFGMPFLLAWAMGFLVAAVGPGIVSAGCAAVKERGYKPNAPNFLLASACFDDAFCIIGFNACLHGFLSNGAAAADAWGYLTGPLSLALGLTGGVLGALLLSATAVWCTPARRSGMLLLTCAALTYTAGAYRQTGAGAIANLTLGLCTRHAWQRGWVWRSLLSGEHLADTPRAAAHMLLGAQRQLGDVWHAVAYPVLFGLLGASFDVRPQPGGPVGRVRYCIIYAVSAILIRIAVTAVTTRPMRRFTVRERLYLSLAWCTKATTQAAFATVPRYLIGLWLTSHAPDARLHGATAEQLRQWGEDIHITCVLAVFIGTPLGTVFINTGAYFLLARERRRRAATVADGSQPLACMLPAGGGAAAAVAHSAAAAGSCAHAAAAAAAAATAAPPGAAAACGDVDSDDSGEWSDTSSLPDLFSANGGDADAHTRGKLYFCRDGGGGGDGADASAPVSFWALPPALRGSTGDGCAADGASSVHAPPADAEAPPPPQQQQQPPLHADAASASAAAAAHAPGDAAAQRARVTITYAGVGAAQEAAVRAALLAAGAAVADVLPAGLAVEVRRHVAAPAYTHPNRYEDPNDDDGVDGGEGGAHGGHGSGWTDAEWHARGAVPPSALRARRTWGRAAAPPQRPPELPPPAALGPQPQAGVQLHSPRAEALLAHSSGAEAGAALPP